MTLSNVVLVVYGAVSLLALTGFAVALDNEKGTSHQLRQDLQTQTQARNTAEWLLHSQEQTLNIFSAIRVANAAARREREALHNEAIQQINAALSSDDCAKQPVPDAADEWLQRLETRARAGGGDTAGH
ncbi:alpha-E domain-containing protein [Citrobacter meridianamericanus]|uniref:alpha-E domain-containing protein n=1 Tax=Citrobacter meridianamericanus TaxID=2894201 RepID=UPI0039BDC8CF